MSSSKGVSTPMKVGYLNIKENRLLPLNEKYRELIGELMYIANCTRLEIFSAIGILSRRVVKSNEHDWKVLKKILGFAFEELDILGHITNQNGIKPAEYNIKAIREFPQPKKVEEMELFLKIKFFKVFSLIADPLTSLIRKNVQFIWTEKQEEAFQNLEKSPYDSTNFG
ncbi:K02A2.6-like [Cordylochernes scorpioides]|uniref:K02A2.6-like n=1 Tax=Cordylochernes scorpioides TaxID=51811 RepID=A0ABY6LS35_9ARAC|nr:K02A2.6-like [Cordylochernes scorpioides]